MAIKGQSRALREFVLAKEEKANRTYLHHLVTLYEAVRFQRGPENVVASAVLGEALRRGGPFRDGDHVWQWSKAEGSIMRYRATLTNHPHGAHKKER